MPRVETRRVKLYWGLLVEPYLLGLGLFGLGLFVDPVVQTVSIPANMSDQHKVVRMDGRGSNLAISRA